MKTYTEVQELNGFFERYNYLKLGGSVGRRTFGGDRYLNQIFYSSPEWRRLRRDIILRDDGCDLGSPDRPIFGKIFVHHICPITLEDIENRSSSILDPNNLICVSNETHQAIHYGDETLLILDPIDRVSGDTTLWR